MFKNDLARSAALAEGLTKYEGKPCSRCESAERYTSSGSCVKCALNRAVQRAGQLPTPRYKLNADTVRGTAFAENRITYHGPECRTCTSTERYTSSGTCVHCAKAAVVQRGDGRPRRKYEHHLKRDATVPLQPSDNKCECCGEIAKLIIDHDHFLETLGFPGDETFRGWICYPCNNGLGQLGDDIAGVQRALDYLKRRQP